MLSSYWKTVQVTQLIVFEFELIGSNINGVMEFNIHLTYIQVHLLKCRPT